ncbi:MAG: hypothetical protein ACI9QD_001276, partial [Thermoproteota archaeon]
PKTPKPHTIHEKLNNYYYLKFQTRLGVYNC